MEEKIRVATSLYRLLCTNYDGGEKRFFLYTLRERDSRDKTKIFVNSSSKASLLENYKQDPNFLLVTNG